VIRLYDQRYKILTLIHPEIVPPDHRSTGFHLELPAHREVCDREPRAEGSMIGMTISPVLRQI
jgi:hypothetical protein